MLELISGCSSEEQQEVDSNLVKVFLNIAAVRLEEQYYGDAICWCTKALQKDQANEKALLRRAKAHSGRHNYQVKLLLCLLKLNQLAQMKLNLMCPNCLLKSKARPAWTTFKMCMTHD